MNGVDIVIVIILLWDNVLCEVVPLVLKYRHVHITLTLIVTVSLRTVAEILNLADAYSASQLKKSCLHFISANAACLLEGRLERFHVAL